MRNKGVIIIVLACILVATGSTSYVLASSKAIPTYTEPEKRPEGLPAEAVFNPYTNEYYDSSEAKWDTELEKYVPLEKDETIIVEIPTEYLPLYSRFDWIQDHQGTTDPVELALIEYQQKNSAYREVHPEVMMRSDWCIDLDGEFSILTNLGVTGLPGLLKEVGGPFSVVTVFAIQDICKTNIGNIDGFTPDEIIGWKTKLNAKPKETEKIVGDILKSLNTETPLLSNDEINLLLEEAGVFALPYLYDEVIINANESLLPYTVMVVPKEVLNEYRIDTDNPDLLLVKEALESCVDEIEIIRNLKSE